MQLQQKTHAERKILEKAESPYIVKLHYAFQTDAKLYLIMDFINGGELFTYLRRERRLSEDRSRIYAAELVEAISYLHSQGVIYRDLKPENILLDRQGHIRIIDFGLSKLDMTENQKTYSFCGTPEYMAPEIAKGTGHDFSADWWSLGALVYEMISGRPPLFDKSKQIMLASKINDDEIPMKEYFSKDLSDFL